MRKKLLAVLLALALVLAFSGMAMALEQADNYDFTVVLDTPNPNTASFGNITVNIEGDVTTGIDYDVYSKSNSVDLVFTTEEGVTLNGAAPVSGKDNEYKATLTDAAPVTVTTSKLVEADTVTMTYIFTLYNLNNYTPTIEPDLYDGVGTTANAYNKSGSNILVPTRAKVYGNIKVKNADGEVINSDNYTVTMTIKGKKTTADIAAVDNNGFFAIPINDFTEDVDVSVTMGDLEIKKASFSLLRPTLDYVMFNDEATTTRDHLIIENGVYTYNTKDEKLVDGDWTRVYIKPVPLSSGAEATVKLAGATKDLNTSGGWYYQSMGRDVYELTVTVKVGSGNDAIDEDYTIYLMAGDYEGPTVKSFEANESSNGRGDDYITVVDQESKTVYVFLPDGETSFYANVTINGDIKDNSLKLGSKTINEGAWNAAGTGTSQLKYADEAGIEYKYAISVIKGNEKYDDATLKSLTVKNGSKASTASEVDIGFDPKVTEYAFPVTDRDVWLNIAAKANDSNATVFINGHQATSITETKLDTDEVTEYEILVVAGDGVTSETYTVTVNGSTGLLQSLSASNVVGLTPAFDADFNTYTAYTAAGTNSTYIVALAKNYSSDYVQVSKANFNAYGQVTSYTALTRAVQGAASVTGELKTGTNIFRIDVLSSASATSAKASYYLTINVPTANPKCVVSSQKLYINGKAQTLSAYNIAGNNYLKLRDVAALLDGTVKEMKVDWDASKWTASMVMPGTFVKRGDELTTLTPPSKYALSTQYFTYNAKPVFPLAYNVTGTGDATGSNYVMLRDVASLLDFGVTYTPTTQTININTASEYIPGL